MVCSLLSILLYLIEILHQTTTGTRVGLPGALLYLIEILHQTTTILCVCIAIIGCILSKFYIKPQPSGPNRMKILQLYLIEILHQTTTHFEPTSLRIGLYLIEILHQTTTCPSVAHGSMCCILSKFYIKPQPATEFVYG